MDAPTAEKNPVRPFAWLATLAFLVGFIGYLALSVPVIATVYDEHPVEPSRVSGPVSDEWNIERLV